MKKIIQKIIKYQTCTVFPLFSGGLHAGISGLADPLLKGAHLQAAMPPHHLQQMPDVSFNKQNTIFSLNGAAPYCTYYFIIFDPSNV